MHPNHPQNQNRHHALESEVGAIKVEMASIKSAVSSLENMQKNLSEDIHAVFRKLDGMNRPNFGLWISVMSLAATFFVGFWVVLELKVTNETTPLRMRQISDAQLHAQEYEQQQRINALLWNASEYGKISKYPEAVSSQHNPNEP